MKTSFRHIVLCFFLLVFGLASASQKQGDSRSHSPFHSNNAHQYLAKKLPATHLSAIVESTSQLVISQEMDKDDTERIVLFFDAVFLYALLHNSVDKVAVSSTKFYQQAIQRLPKYLLYHSLKVPF